MTVRISAPSMVILPLVMVLMDASETNFSGYRGAIDQARLARIAVDPFEDRVLGIAFGAEKLNRRVGSFVQAIGDRDLGHRHFLAGAVTEVELIGGIEGQQPAHLNLHRCFTQHPLHTFMFHQLAAEGLTRADMLHGDVETALGKTQPAHAMRKARDAEANLHSL